jgi:uncharacterized protein YhbP (UPF0306 family)
MTNKQKLFELLRSQKLLTLAICDPTPWVSTAYYYLDEDFCFYIFTDSKTRHGQIIEKNKNVACNIFDSHQKITDKKIGVQVEGVIEKIKGISNLKWALKMWNAANPGLESIINLKNMQNKVVNGSVYKITPKSIKFFSEELYSDDEFEVFKF